MGKLRCVMLLVAVFVLGAPSGAQAQALTPDGIVAADGQPAASPFAVSPLPAELALPVSLGDTRTEESREALAPLPQARNRNRAGLPLIIAGGIAFGAGIIAGGDAGTILMLGGGGVAAFGTYIYFKG